MRTPPQDHAQADAAPAKRPAKSAPTSPAKAKGKPKAEPGRADASVEKVDTRYLESLIGYNARRAALAVIGVFLERMAPYGLRPVDFSILSLVTHNPGITARQLCSALGILPPNMVGMVSAFERRGLVERRPHPSDRRAQGLHLTPAGVALMNEAEQTASALEQDVACKLTRAQQKQLMDLLQKIYL